MKRLLNIKKKKKVKVNDDPFLATDVVDTIGQQQQQNSNNNSQQQQSSSTVGTPTGYAYARSVYVSDTINPSTSNEDGFGSGSGGTLRSRSGRMRGSAGSSHHHSSLIPVIYEQDGNGGGNVDNEVYERLTGGGGRNRNTNTLEEGKRWSRIPEQTRNSTEQQQQQQVNPNNISDFNTGTLPNEIANNSRQDSDGACTGGEGLFGICTANDGDDNTSSTTNSVTQQSQHLQQQRSTIHHRSISSQNNNNVQQPQKESINIILQPDAIYEEHYGDAYIDSLIKYLYPAGYQSMRPRSGPWKLSIFIFCLFTWLSIFIVGHCYERGQQYYNDGANGAYYETGGVDDAYLQEVDDDMIVMETRWCGSKLLYFMWIVSVWITVLSMSYCSIIGYVKVRDIAVANGRSQPPGMLSLGSNVGDGRSGSGSNNGTMNVGGSVGRSDYYAMLDNVSGMMTHGTSLRNTVGSNRGSDAGASSIGNGEGGYSSYQDGEVTRRYAPSIYQSDGTPQFWGGHIYRPTQAAVAMTNRP